MMLCVQNQMIVNENAPHFIDWLSIFWNKNKKTITVKNRKPVFYDVGTCVVLMALREMV